MGTLKEKVMYFKKHCQTVGGKETFVFFGVQVGFVDSLGVR